MKLYPKEYIPYHSIHIKFKTQARKNYSAYACRLSRYTTNEYNKVTTIRVKIVITPGEKKVMVSGWTVKNHEVLTLF